MTRRRLEAACAHELDRNPPVTVIDRTFCRLFGHRWEACDKHSLRWCRRCNLILHTRSLEPVTDHVGAGVTAREQADLVRAVDAMRDLAGYSVPDLFECLAEDPSVWGYATDFVKAYDALGAWAEEAESALDGSHARGYRDGVREEMARNGEEMARNEAKVARLEAALRGIREHAAGWHGPRSSDSGRIRALADVVLWCAVALGEDEV